jgi:hypothetical protein
MFYYGQWYVLAHIAHASALVLPFA